MPLRVLDLFSGIGGLSLGLERTGGFETVAFCEIEEYPRQVLAKHWPSVPIHTDVRKLRGEDVGAVDVICGGYPCQPFSTAGRRQGKKDDRHLWPEFSRLVAELRPSWVIGENVAGHISMGLDDVLSDLEGQGYSCRTFVIPACAVGAPHRRDRTWVVGYSDSHSKPDRAIHDEAPGVQDVGDTASVRAQRPSQGGFSPKSDQAGRGMEQGRKPMVSDSYHSDAQRVIKGGDDEAVRCVTRKRPSGLRCRARRNCEWAPEPSVGRVAHGVPNRSHRLRALGNAVVPQIPEMIGRAILEAN